MHQYNFYLNRSLFDKPSLHPKIVLVFRKLIPGYNVGLLAPNQFLTPAVMLQSILDRLLGDNKQCLNYTKLGNRDRPTLKTARTFRRRHDNHFVFAALMLLDESILKFVDCYQIVGRRYFESKRHRESRSNSSRDSYSLDRYPSLEREFDRQTDWFHGMVTSNPARFYILHALP